MIEFEVLAMKAETDNMYTIFLLKKNIRMNIIKTILKYSPMVALETLREWKIVIISVDQGYKFTKSQYDYKTSIEMTYRGRGIPMDIRKTKVL